MEMDFWWGVVKSFVYTGSEQSVTVSNVKLGNTTLTANTDYEVTNGTTGTAVNTHTVTVTGKGQLQEYSNRTVEHWICDTIYCDHSDSIRNYLWAKAGGQHADERCGETGRYYSSRHVRMEEYRNKAYCFRQRHGLLRRDHREHGSDR